MKNKEQIYDEVINPLMTTIIETCQEHGIAFFAHYKIPTEENEGLSCTTAIPDETGVIPQDIRRMHSVVQSFPSLRITKVLENGNAEITHVVG